MAVCFQINCTNELGSAYKGAAIMEINKQTMMTENIRKSVRTNYIRNVYKNRIVWDRSWAKKKYSWHIF